MTRVYSTIAAGNFASRDFAVVPEFARRISRVFAALRVCHTPLSLSLSPRRLFSSGTRVFSFLHDLLPFFFIPAWNRNIASIVPRRFWQRRQCAVLGRRPNVINCKSGHCFSAREFNVTHWGSLRPPGVVWFGGIYTASTVERIRGASSHRVSPLSLSLVDLAPWFRVHPLATIALGNDATVDKHHCPISSCAIATRRHFPRRNEMHRGKYHRVWRNRR